MVFKLLKLHLTSTVEGCDQFRIYLYDSWIDGEKLDLSISDICYKGEEEKYFSLIYLRDPILRKKKRFLGKKLDTDNYLEYYTEITKYIKNNKGRFLGSKVIGAFLLIVMAPATPPVNKINQYYDSLGEIGLKLYFMEKVEYDADWGPQQSTNHFNPIYESQRYIGIFVGIKF